MELYEKLKKLIKDDETDLIRLSEYIGVSSDVISLWTMGKDAEKIITVKNLKGLASYFSVKPSYLLQEEFDEPKSTIGHVGEKIKERRISLGISQRKLADKLGYKDRSTITKIEAGDSHIPIAKLEQFARNLHCSVSDLIGENSIIQDEETNSIVILFKKLSEHNKLIVRKIMELLFNLQN